MSKTVLITGGTGFIGKRAAGHFCSQGWEVWVTGREAPGPNSNFLDRNFQDIAPGALHRFSLVVHLAAVTDTCASDDEQWQVNAHDAVAFAERCANAGVAFVYASSCAVYGANPLPFREDQPAAPLNAYGAAKLALDKWSAANSYGVGLRFSNVVGTPDEEAHKKTAASVAGRVVAAAVAGAPVEIYRACSRDLIWARDAADAVLNARHLPHGVYNVSMGEAFNYLGLAIDAATAAGVQTVSPKIIPNPHGTKFQERTQASCEKLRAAFAAAIEAPVPPWNPMPPRVWLRKLISALPAPARRA